jgi:sugar phosphate isomerase/epimerase
MTLEGFLEKAVEMDLDGVELTAYYFPTLDDEYLYTVKRRALGLGLEISGAAVGNNFCQPDPAKRDEQVALVCAWIGIAYKLGAPLLRVFAGPVPEGHTESEAREWTVASLKQCVPDAAAHGITLALENHGGITLTAAQTISLVEAVDSKWVAINLDTGNYRQNPYDDIARTAPYAVTAHAKTEIYLDTGKIDADFSRIIGLLDEASYRGYLSIEYEAAEDPMTAVPRFAAELKRLTSLCRS